jgi:hypothetical protein
MMLFMTTEGMEITAKSEPKTFQEAVVKQAVLAEFKKERDANTKFQKQMTEELTKILDGKIMILEL